MRKRSKALALAALAVVVLGSGLWAADPVPTTITIEGMT